MFDYPASSLADDEGTYVQQAWAVLREGRLSPYTYTYDHVPGGWLQIAAWLGLVGPRAFGSVTATARVLMLVLHVAAVVFLFLAARRLGMGRTAASLGALAFAASPLAVFYGREAILDNIMAFWLVVALALLAAARGPRLAAPRCGARTPRLRVRDRERASLAHRPRAWRGRPARDRVIRFSDSRRAGPRIPRAPRDPVPRTELRTGRRGPHQRRQATGGRRPPSARVWHRARPVLECERPCQPLSRPPGRCRPRGGGLDREIGTARRGHRRP